MIRATAKSCLREHEHGTYYAAAVASTRRRDDGGAAAVLLAPSVAEASNGQPLVLGERNLAGHPTSLSGRQRTDPVLGLEGAFHTLVATTADGVALKGMAEGTGYGVVAFGSSGEGEALLAIGTVRFSTLKRVTIPSGSKQAIVTTGDFNRVGDTSAVLATVQSPGGRLAFVDTTQASVDGTLRFELVEEASQDVDIAYWVVDEPIEGTPTIGP